MKIELISIGKENEKMYAAAIDEFSKRINRYQKFTIKNIASKAIATSPIAQQLTSEGLQIENAMQDGDILIILDDKGKTLQTEQFAKHVDKWQQLPGKRIVFLIGGAYGISDHIKQKATFSLSLSAFTFPHQLVRLIFVEQLYRAYTVLNNENYHHE
jgi:23S rRNA (pseudouridine1915-N3)-methyltransferase